MDLVNFIPKSDTVEVVLKHPKTGEPLLNDGNETEMTVTLWAVHSPEYKAALYEQADARLKIAQETKEKTIKAAQLEKDAVTLLANATVSWDITYEGKSPRYSVTKAKEIYTKAFWIRPQLEEALQKSLDFIEA